MSRLIDADWTKQRLEAWRNDLAKTYGENDEYVLCLEEVLMILDNAPTVDPVKHGHWIEHEVGLICSECGHYTEAMYDEPFNNEFGRGWALKRPYYCGYCGAKMDEVKDEQSYKVAD